MILIGRSIVFLVISLLSHSASHFSQNYRSTPKNGYLEYYHTVIQAKRNQMSGDFELAGANYETAFQNSNRIDFYDLKNYGISCKKGGKQIDRKAAKRLYKYCGYDTVSLYQLIPKIIF